MVLAAGVRYRRLDVTGTDELVVPSVHYAAEFEARLCRGDLVAVVGGGNPTGRAALFLARSTASVNLVIRRQDLNRDMSWYLTDRIERNPTIRTWRTSEVTDLGGGRLRGRRRAERIHRAG